MQPFLRGYLPSFLRWTRVRRSNLRCFFLDMRLRRFLMTEPMNSATSSTNRPLHTGPVCVPATLPKWTVERKPAMGGAANRPQGRL